jgi:subtilisin family serine protease
MIFSIKKHLIAVAILASSASIASAQEVDHTKEEASQEYQWHHGDFNKDGVAGISTYKAYEELLKNKTSQKVIVAIIDSGTESFHPDLKDNIWVNKDEIPDNGIDDDKNGYIDDVHGWSFIGGKDGDVDADLLEFTRIYKDLYKRFGKKDPNSIAPADAADYKRYLEMKKNYDHRLETAKQEKAQALSLSLFYETANKAICTSLKKEKLTVADVENFEPTSDIEKQYKEFMKIAIPEDWGTQLAEWKKNADIQIKYQLSLDYDPRTIVGDNYADTKEQYYGNNHIDGPSADHGTHVGGIVGATNNDFGVDGICQNVELMVIRCVPNGDERDKDVANAIRYAVDNGAKVINMSFGKSYSPQKTAVDEAVRYAESKGVLLVHAAGNDAKNIDKEANFPTKFYDDGTACSTWIEVGASGPELKTLPASFSNYGIKEVDVFAPGVDIYAPVPDNKYAKNSGTSMASPVTAGVAAAILSYYPELTAKDVKAIILQSSIKYGKSKVVMPGSPKKKVKFKKLSATGGVVNLYAALQLAATWKPGSAQ